MHHASLWNAGGWNAEDEAERVSVIVRQSNANRNMEPKSSRGGSIPDPPRERVVPSFPHPSSSGLILNIHQDKKTLPLSVQRERGMPFFCDFSTPL